MYSWVYFTFTKGGKFEKPLVILTVYVHMYTLENSPQNDCNRELFSWSITF